jgi:quercetin dioxygenase-like cupin family protein
MIARRDIFVALIAVSATLCVIAVAAEQKSSVLQTSVFDWNSIPASETKVGSVRQIFRGPTATLDELEMHVTTLNVGQASHPPHQHPNEELVVVKEGTLEAYVNGEWRKVGPGSVIFNASNQFHGVRNAGTGPATYHVINWKTSATPK